MLYFCLFALVAAATAAPSSRIVNGEAATSTAVAPWQVSLQKSGSHFCGGSIISAGFVMSACHCKQNFGADVVMGTVDYTQPKYNVRGTFTCHPQYSTFPATDYDYSIVTLASNVDLNDADVSAIAIANKEYPAGTIAQITGWGKTHGNINQIPTQLQVATTPLMSQDDCKAIWGNLRITDRMQCVGGTGENSGCQGDSGGPLAYQDPADGVWYLIGNTSWGSSNCQTSMPAIWSKNVIVYDWIQSFL